MSPGPDSPERDPALERAWRAHSREGPPPALDRAILAAAHRAVGSGPQAAGEATRPQRWWMPLAAAATIGAIAVGLLQLTPDEQSLVAPNERLAVIARRGADEKPPAPPVSPGADSAVKERDAAVPPLRDSIAGIAQKKKQEVPATPAAAPAKPAAPLEREQSVVTGKLAARAPEPQAQSQPQPQPFPAATDDARKNAVAEMKRDAPRQATAQAADSFAQAPAVAPPAPPVAMAEEQAASRKDAARDRQQLAAATDKTTAGAQPGRSALASEGATSSFAAPPPAAAPPRARESGGARNEAPVPMQTVPAPAAPAVGAAAPSLLAKTPASTEELRAKARDPDAWIVRIRKLRDEGNTVEAMRELREFRSLVPDAERRLPADLITWASTVK